MIEVIAIVAILLTTLFVGYTLHHADRTIRNQRKRITELEKAMIICYHEATPHAKMKIKELMQ